MIWFVSLMSCIDSQDIEVTVCAVDVFGAEPATAQAGETITLSVSPVTTVFDTAVYVDGERATVESVDRENCDECDACRALDLNDDGLPDCDACGDCDSCDRLCEQTCQETVQFVLPDAVQAGERSVQMFNAFGVTRPLALSVTADAEDTGSSNSEDSGVTGEDTATGR
ncbi:MAG: hypothetical protein AAFV53_37985 [Myxococcota bacterium]